MLPFFYAFFTYIINNKKRDKMKLTIEDLIEYLEVTEGSKIHRNKTEEDITAFYGVYRYANPTFKGWVWLDFVSEISNLKDYRTNKKTRALLNKVIFSNKYYSEYYSILSKRFHRANMSEMYLDRFPNSKTAITYFSLVTNAGINRASKVLQESLNNLGLGLEIEIDGNFGDESVIILDKVTNSEKLNKKMLENMQDFYDHLIKKNPSKYSIYKNGWANRLKALA